MTKKILITIGVILATVVLIVVLLVVALLWELYYITELEETKVNEFYSDDGAGLQGNVPAIRWTDNSVMAIVSGNEQKDQLYIMYYDGTSEDRQSSGWYTTEELTALVKDAYGENAEYVRTVEPSNQIYTGNDYYALIGTYDGESCAFYNTDPYNNRGGLATGMLFVDENVGFITISWGGEEEGGCLSYGGRR